MKQINERTLKLVFEKLSALRDATLSRGEMLEITTLMKVLAKLDPGIDIVEIQHVIEKYQLQNRNQLQQIEALKRRIAEFEMPVAAIPVIRAGWGETIGRTFQDAQTATSFWVGKKVHRNDYPPAQCATGIVKSETIDGRLVVQFEGNKQESIPLPATLFKIVQ